MCAGNNGSRITAQPLSSWRPFRASALNEREQQGLIKAFEYTFELSWNTCGRCAARATPICWAQRHPAGGLSAGADQRWRDLDVDDSDRNLTSHTYNRATAEAIAANITNRYLACFQQLRAITPAPAAGQGEAWWL